MGIIKNFIDELAKHKMLVYFVILWGVKLFVGTLYGFIEWGFFQLSGLLVIDMFFHWSEFVAGFLLLLFGYKLLNKSFLEGIKNHKLLIYFLIVWVRLLSFSTIRNIDMVLM